MKLRNSYITTALLFFCCIMAHTITVSASNIYLPLDSGNAAYNKNDFSKAITFYQKFLSEDIESAQAYYNLGNCYYRLNQISQAILYYEKALKLTPGDHDIQFNLQLANQKIIDKLPSDTSLSIYGGWKTFLNMFTEKQWALICISLLCISLLLFALYLSVPALIFKKISFWSGFVIFFLCIFAFLFAHEQYDSLNSHNTAIVMSSVVTVKGAPEEKATQLFVIHEGTKVSIEKTNGEWTEIRLPNGNQGWLYSSDISPI